MTPKLHQSTELVYPVPRIISAAKYSGAPIKVNVSAAGKRNFSFLAFFVVVFTA